MKKFVIYVLLTFIIACNQPSTSGLNKINQPKDSSFFYPVVSYIRQQINLVHSTSYFISVIKTSNGKRDSIKLNVHQFDSLAQPFLDCDITNLPLKKNYQASVFKDESTKSYTLNYTAIDRSLPIQSIDILLNEDNQEVKNIFINTFENADDSSVTQKMGWQPYHNFYINRIIQYKNTQQSIEQIVVIWNSNN